MAEVWERNTRGDRTWREACLPKEDIAILSSIDCSTPGVPLAEQVEGADYCSLI